MKHTTAKAGHKAPDFSKRKISGIRIRKPSGGGTGLSVSTEFEPEHSKSNNTLGWYRGQNEKEDFFDDHKKAHQHVRGAMAKLMGVKDKEEAGEGEKEGD
jgi:hypothetical protein